MLFVHGFPDGWRSWRRQMAAVAAEGYRAIAFVTRGYGGSSKPEDPAHYTVFRFLGDLVGILATLGIDHATLVGHDFGATVSWNAAICGWCAPLTNPLDRLGLFLPDQQTPRG